MRRMGSRPARAVLRVLDRRERLAQQLRETDAALRANARALLDAKGMKGMLEPEKLRRLAEGELVG